MPFSPDKFHHGSDRTGDSPIQNGATDGGPARDDGDDDEPEEEPVWAEFSSDYYQGQHERLAHENYFVAKTAENR